MKRSEQKMADTWDLVRMYNPKNLQADLKECHQMVEVIKKIKQFKTKEDIITTLERYFALMVKLENIYVYYSHMQDTDYANSSYAGNLNYIKAENNKMMSELSYVMPSIARVDNKLLEEILHDEKYQAYHKTMRDILHNKERFLSDGEELIISRYGLNSSLSYNVYSVFTNSELTFNDVKDSKKKTHKLTEGMYANYIRSHDRTLRKHAFEELFNTYHKFNQTLTTTYLGDIKQDLIGMRNRHYQSTLQQALEPNQIDEQIYHRLLKSVEDNLKINHDYLATRQALLKYDELHLYDVYVSLVEELETEYPYEQAQEMVLAALQIFPSEYVAIIKEAFEKRWIDVYENEGKRTGAYSGGSYSSDPYILLNYQSNLNDVFTLAHELGHSMHSYFANKNNPYQDANYQIFIAEVASTVNELLLINDLLKKTDDKTMQKYLYNYWLEQFRTTLVRQTMFARFELESHLLMEENKEVNADILNDLYFDINKKYFGKDVVIDEEIKYEWSRIPHFYYDYYVYQYATSYSVALNIVERIIAKEKGIMDKYLDFLKLGDRVYPLEALQTLDIDLEKDDVFDQAMKKYQEVLNKFADVSK